MKRKIHIEAVKKAIDSMFRERIPKNLILKNERKVVWVTQGIGTIDTRSETELSSLFETMFEAYKHKHPDNTRELFIEVELERAKEYQTYFPEYKTNSEHKTYYFELQRWIDFLSKVAKPTGETQQTKTKTKQETPKTFEELFYNPEHAEPCLKILSELQPPVIDAINNYIGKAKGVFPLWINVLKKHKPEPLIKHFKDTVYKDILNQKVKGLNLSKDASEFRKRYKKLENDKIELDIKTILSQYSQSGKLGK